MSGLKAILLMFFTMPVWVGLVNAQDLNIVVLDDSHAVVSIKRIDFFRAQFRELVDYAGEVSGKVPDSLLSERQLQLLAWLQFDSAMFYSTTLPDPVPLYERLSSPEIRGIEPLQEYLVNLKTNKTKEFTRYYAGVNAVLPFFSDMRYYHPDVYFCDQYGLPLNVNYTGSVRDYWPSGGMRAQLQVKNGIAQGEYEEWWENGNKKCQVMYGGGHPSLIHTYWYESGGMREKVFSHIGYNETIFWDEEGNQIGSTVLLDP